MLALQKSAVVAKSASRRSVAAKATKFDEELVQTAVSLVALLRHRIGARAHWVAPTLSLLAPSLTDRPKFWG